MIHIHYDYCADLYIGPVSEHTQAIAVLEPEVEPELEPGITSISEHTRLHHPIAMPKWINISGVVVTEVESEGTFGHTLNGPESLFLPSPLTRSLFFLSMISFSSPPPLPPPQPLPCEPKASS